MNMKIVYLFCAHFGCYRFGYVSINESSECAEIDCLSAMTSKQFFISASNV